MAYSKNFAEVTAVDKIRALVGGYRALDGYPTAKECLRDSIIAATHTALGHFSNTGIVQYHRFGGTIEDQRVSYFVGEIRDLGEGRSAFDKDYEWFIDLDTCEITGGRL